jgi:hypothetical protein
MRPHRPSKLDKKSPTAVREAIEDIRDVRYVGVNRDVSLGENDRTGRHFDEESGSGPDEGSAASENHEAD